MLRVPGKLAPADADNSNVKIFHQQQTAQTNARAEDKLRRQLKMNAADSTVADAAR